MRPFPPLPAMIRFPVSKETERAALHKAICQVANDLRGGVDGWDFKT